MYVYAYMYTQGQLQMVTLCECMDLQTLNGNWSRHNYVSYVFQAEIDTRSSDLYKLMKTGEKMIRQGHYAKEEVRSALSWETTHTHTQYTHTHTHNTHNIYCYFLQVFYMLTVYTASETHIVSHIFHTSFV